MDGSKPIVQIIAGVSGVGKTYMRTKLWEYYPVVDMGIIRQENPGKSWHMMHYNIFLPQIHELLYDDEEDFIVIEGYFLPQSRSLHDLLGFLKVEGATPLYWLLWAPIQVCEDRIAAQYHSGDISAELCSSRIKALHRCWTNL